MRAPGVDQGKTLINEVAGLWFLDPEVILLAIFTFVKAILLPFYGKQSTICVLLMKERDT